MLDFHTVDITGITRRLPSLKNICLGIKQESSSWHSLCYLCFRLMLSLLQARTVNLCRIAAYFETVALVESSYRRIKRFFQWDDFSCLQLIPKSASNFLLRTFSDPAVMR